MQDASGTTEGNSYDVIVIGGALAGAATALQLLRGRPGLRVLVVERSEVFGRRVGEATVEISAFFLMRVLGLTQHLNEAHLVKQGMRFWFASGEAGTLADCSELGGLYLVRLPAFQVDRAVLDEEVLRRARELGAEVWRPASVSGVKLVPGGEQVVTVRVAGKTREARGRWVVDASGVAALLARQEGWWRANEAHPTSAVWARWRGVKDWDGLELAGKFPEWAASCRGIRNTATNHLMGDGWWAWCIPLKGGDVSIGVVFDSRLVEWPQDGSLGERLKEFLGRHPVGRELLERAEVVAGDVHWRRQLPYVSTTMAGDGFVLVGDAAGFLDPFYSPGMDWVAYTTTAATELILAERGGAEWVPRVAKYNRDFTRSYAEWFGALYRDKYFYLGEYDLMRLAFLLDLGLYYLGVVSQPYMRGAGALRHSVFTQGRSAPASWLMRTYNRRLAAIGAARRRRGALGRRNRGERFMFGGYSLAMSSVWPLLRALAGWMWLEVCEGWRAGGKGRGRKEEGRGKKGANDGQETGGGE